MTKPVTEVLYLSERVRGGEILIGTAANIFVTRAGLVSVISPDLPAALGWTTIGRPGTYSWLCYTPEQGWQKTTKEEVDKVLQWWFDHPDEWSIRGELVGLEEPDPSVG